MPNYKKVSKAFNIKYIKISKHKDISKVISKLIKINGPVICELLTSEDQPSLFKQGYKKTEGFLNSTLSEMYPFISDQ